MCVCVCVWVFKDYKNKVITKIVSHDFFISPGFSESESI